ncbi:hypothetical protein CAPTEDRAFT_196174 [Capitella teleta]|uniref:FAM20 C-terminal domain-containing protein n=1 Tax=Capitella teleta TaxID=283909 RepID=R7U0T1_CAPTE|nr:hypothetical protein CAPTEDRAFT_196174 [Capitella teleta]|eukprot:ELT99482.1 hypothetical protein CAPTEDRAFT_196174 [Capitella teleta]
MRLLRRLDLMKGVVFVITLWYLLTVSKHQEKIEDIWNAAKSTADEHYLYSEDFEWRKVTVALTEARIEKVFVLSPEDIELRVVFPKLRNLDFGTTYKWLLCLEGDQMAIFKPKWYDRDYSPQFWSDGFELHTSEIASFHLDRILGFRRVPFASGRLINFRSEILPVASRYLLETSFAKGSEWCLSATCYFCTEPLITCSTGGLIEGAASYFVDGLSDARHDPFSLSSSASNRKGCDNLWFGGSLPEPPLAPLEQRVELSVLDFLTNHFDSKLYFHKKGFLVYADRGRSFTDSYVDDDTNLAALKICCRMPFQTKRRLEKLSTENQLNRLLKESLQNDAIGSLPILSEEHLAAVQRRLQRVLQIARKCALEVKSN